MIDGSSILVYKKEIYFNLAKLCAQRLITAVKRCGAVCHSQAKTLFLTRNRKHRRAAAKPAACAPNAVNTREQRKEGGRVR